METKLKRVAREEIFFENLLQSLTYIGSISGYAVSTFTEKRDQY